MRDGAWFNFVSGTSVTNVCASFFQKQHDAQLDYYGKRLATCSSDKTIKIFSVVDGKPQGEGVVLKGLVISIPLPSNSCSDTSFVATLCLFLNSL